MITKCNGPHNTKVKLVLSRDREYKDNEKKKSSLLQAMFLFEEKSTASRKMGKIN